MKQLIVLKLGGSAITDKSRKLTPDLVTIHRSADQIAKYKRLMILLHGGGSFAHPFAERGNLAKGFKDRSQFKALDETELYLDQLSRIIQVALLQRNVGFVPFRPMSYMETSQGNLSRAFLHPITDALRLGLVPLSHGDVVMDSKIGFSIVSARSEEHTSELQSRPHLVCRLLLEKKKTARSMLFMSTAKYSCIHRHMRSVSRA